MIRLVITMLVAILALAIFAPASVQAQHIDTIWTLMMDDIGRDEGNSEVLFSTSDTTIVVTNATSPGRNHHTHLKRIGLGDGSISEGLVGDFFVADGELDEAGYVACGILGEEGDWRNAVIKIDQDYETVWENAIGDSGGENTSHLCIIKTADGRYVTTGSYNRTNNFDSSKIFLRRFERDGSTSMDRVYGYGVGFKVLRTSDGGYAVFGSPFPRGGLIFLKTDQDGREVFSKTFWSNDSLRGWPLDVLERERDFLLCVEWGGKYHLVSLGKNGDSLNLFSENLFSGSTTGGWGHFATLPDDRVFLLFPKWDRAGRNCWPCVCEISGSDILWTEELPHNQASLQVRSMCAVGDDGLAVLCAPEHLEERVLLFYLNVHDEQSVSSESAIPIGLYVSSYPNPFNSSTVIRYALPAPGKTSLLICDPYGREVKRLLFGYQSAGAHAVNWYGSNLPAGMYIVRLQTESQTITQKVVLVR